ncbi:hypothetical protein [Brevibacillus reuszeri]|uniref:hypothetical protein n=1 Tax=Brevibacillus reuszeri TaxID=54915 RepID=UPI001BB40F1B|nr:hypothetical protein [Brevibacillus reuszeri]
MDINMLTVILAKNSIEDKTGWEVEKCPSCGRKYVWRHDPKLEHGGAILGYEKKEIECPDCNQVIRLPKSVEAQYYW